MTYFLMLYMNICTKKELLKKKSNSTVGIQKHTNLLLFLDNMFLSNNMKILMGSSRCDIQTSETNPLFYFIAQNGTERSFCLFYIFNIFNRNIFLYVNSKIVFGCILNVSY